MQSTRKSEVLRGESPYLVCGISFRSSPVSLRERMAVAPERFAEALEFLIRQPGVRECMLVSTCNRTEIYLSGETWLDGYELYTRFARSLQQLDLGEDQHRIYVHRGAEAVRHLYRVASGLDSMVLGEPQILGQVKEAFRAAESAGTIGRDLHRWVPQAFRAARQARSDTGIGESAVSVSYAAIQLARKIFEDLQGKRVVLVGAGKMSKIAALHLRDAGVHAIVVTNRTLPRARELAAACGGTAVPFAQRMQAIREADIVICSTHAADFLLDSSAVSGILARRNARPLLLLDLSVPRNLDPAIGTLNGAYLFNIDDLKSVVEANQRAREKEAVRAEKLLSSAVEHYFREESQNKVGPAIAAIRNQVRSICHEELERIRQKAPELVREHEAELEVMLHRIAQKIVHPVICELKSSARREDPSDALRVIQSFFGLRRETPLC